MRDLREGDYWRIEELRIRSWRDACLRRWGKDQHGTRNTEAGEMVANMTSLAGSAGPVVLLRAVIGRWDKGAMCVGQAVL